MSQIVLKGIDKFYGSNHVLKNLNLVVEDGEFMTLLGPSGCGKTYAARGGRAGKTAERHH